MKRKNLLLLSLISIGIIMLFGSSYSLIMNEINPNYKFIVDHFDKEYIDNYKVTLKENDIEINVSVINKTVNKINYRLDLVNNVNQDENKNITYYYELNSNIVNCNLYNNTTIVQNKSLEVSEQDDYKIKIHYSGSYL